MFWMILGVITPCIRILDFYWLIAGVFSYLGLLSFIFAVAGVFAWGFNFFTLACIKPPNSFGIFLLYFMRKVTWLIKFETRKCSEVKDLTFFPSAAVFAKTYFTFLPSRAVNHQIHSEYFNHCLTKQIEYSWKRQAIKVLFI